MNSIVTLPLAAIPVALSNPPTARPHGGDLCASSVPMTEVDDILALIKAHREATANCSAGASSSRMDEDDYFETEFAVLVDAENDAFVHLLEAVPKTLPAMLAWVSHLNSVAESDQAWRFDDRTAIVTFLGNLDRALGLAVRS